MVAHTERWHVRCFESLRGDLEDVVMTKLIALLLLASTAACGELSYARSSGAGDQGSNDPSSASAPSEPTPIQPAQGSQVNQQDPAPSVTCPGAPSCDRIVFLSSKTYSASYFHSAHAADDACNALAKASSDPEIQKRKFAAWMSDATTSPKARFVRGGTKYNLPNGDRVADDYDDLTSDTGIYNSIDIDENGGHHESGSAWTGTRPDGSATLADCSSWQLTTGQGTKGDITKNGSGWSAANGENQYQYNSGGSTNQSSDNWNSCQSESAHIYCFEQ